MDPIIREIANTRIKGKLPLTERVNSFILGRKNWTEVKRESILSNKLIQLTLGKNAHTLRKVILTRSHILKTRDKRRTWKEEEVRRMYIG